MNVVSLRNNTTDAKQHGEKPQQGNQEPELNRIGNDARAAAD